MGLNLQNKKIGFFDRLKVAIFKLEDYGMFLGERISTAFKYFFILVLLVSIILTFVTTYDFFKMINKTKEYIANELPDFIYEEGKVKFNQNIEAYDHEYNFKLIINTNDELDDNTLKEYKDKIDNFGIIMLQNKAIFISNDIELQKEYSEITNYYGLGINNKSDLQNILNTSNINAIIGTYFIADFIGTYIGNLISIFLDVCVIAVFGWIAARFCGVNFRILLMAQLAIYSLSLSIILNCLYNVAYILFNFYIEQFNVIYLLISYVYIIAAIFMIKYDIIKQNEELQKVIEEQMKLRKQKEEEEAQEKEDNDKQTDEDEKEKTEEEPVIETNKEPDGSEI